MNKERISEEIASHKNSIGFLMLFEMESLLGGLIRGLKMTTKESATLNTSSLFLI